MRDILSVAIAAGVMSPALMLCEMQTGCSWEAQHRPSCVWHLLQVEITPSTAPGCSLSSGVWMLLLCVRAVS